MSAPTIEVAPLEPAPRAHLRDFFTRIETLLEAERAQLPIWVVVAFMGGISAWFALGTSAQWLGATFLALAMAAGAFMLPGRSGRWLGAMAIAFAIGCGLIWVRSIAVDASRAIAPVVTEVRGRVLSVEPRPARGDLRLTIAPVGGTLPDRIRVSVRTEPRPPGLGAGATIRARVRLTPPPPMPLPGGHDFARDAYFKRIGGSGTMLGSPTIVTPAKGSGLEPMRLRLAEHIAQQLPGAEGGIAVALATGDQNAVDEATADDIRRSGLAHLLSVSGLHIAAVVGFAMWAALRLLALWPWLALRTNLVLVAAGVGAATGIAYTLLTGMQVPTVRSCVAALLVLAGIALGREALSLRIVAVGALVILTVRPESIAGASFQMSFAAVLVIVALHRSRVVQQWFGPREESLPMRGLRGFGSLALTGLAIEIALIPFALFHFHKAGLYGVAANLIAIPLTTFAIMPLEGLALVADLAGAGWPFWWLAGRALDVLLSVAGTVADAPGAVATVAGTSTLSFAAMVGGLLWLAIWQTRWRIAGLVPFGVGMAVAFASEPPDVLVTGDGRHLAVVSAEGRPYLLRDRTGEFVRSLVNENSGFDGEAELLDALPGTRCSPDSCITQIDRGGRTWHLLALRSRHSIRWSDLVVQCRRADIVVADRRLPQSCTPRWLKLDRTALLHSGGVAIRLGKRPAVETVADLVADHPWASSPSMAHHTASSLPDGSMKWKRRPPGNEKIGRAITPPAATTASNASSRRSTRMTGKGAESASPGWPFRPMSVVPPTVAE